MGIFTIAKGQVSGILLFATNTLGGTRLTSSLIFIDVPRTTTAPGGLQSVVSDSGSWSGARFRALGQKMEIESHTELRLFPLKPVVLQDKSFCLPPFGHKDDIFQHLAAIEKGAHWYLSLLAAVRQVRTHPLPERIVL